MKHPNKQQREISSINRACWKIKREAVNQAEKCAQCGRSSYHYPEGAFIRIDGKLICNECGEKLKHQDTKTPIL